MDKIYFDNSATTPLTPEAREKMLEAMDIYGNPSSLHTMGVEAEKLVNEAKRNILTALGIKYLTTLDCRQLIFTASGTEADNLALLGTTGAKNYTSQKNIIISDSEHPAIMETAKELERRGFIVHKIPTADGIPDYEMIEQVADSDTILVSFMLVNNETGAIYDVRRISDIVKGEPRRHHTYRLHAGVPEDQVHREIARRRHDNDIRAQDRRSEGRRSPLGLAGDS